MCTVQHSFTRQAHAAWLAGPIFTLCFSRLLVGTQMRCICITSFSLPRCHGHRSLVPISIEIGLQAVIDKAPHQQCLRGDLNWPSSFDIRLIPQLFYVYNLDCRQFITKHFCVCVPNCNDANLISYILEQKYIS